MLYRGFQSVKRRDSDVFRKMVYEELKNLKPIIGIIQKFYESCPSLLKAFLLFGYGLKSWFFAPGLRNADNLGIWEYENERKQMDYIKRIADPTKVDLVHPSMRNLSLIKFQILGSHFRMVSQIMRILNLISSKNDFLVSCRLSSTLFYYLWYSEQLKTSSLSKIFLSSEANPCSMGALWASKKYRVKTFYIPHGHVADNPPGLSYDVCLLDGPALEDLFRAAGGIQGKVIYKGMEGASRPILIGQRPKCVGFFLSLIYDDQKVFELMKQVVKILEPEEILIRLHPNEILKRKTDLLQRIQKETSLRIISSDNLMHDIRKCDLIISGNSSVHLTALKQGVPTVHLDGMDKLPPDTRHFVRDRIVYHADLGKEDLSMQKIAEFYSAEWPSRFMKYDPHYEKSPADLMNFLRKQIFSE